jgi:GNAT superfamily N-acetyltransferase
LAEVITRAFAPDSNCANTDIEANEYQLEMLKYNSEIFIAEDDGIVAGVACVNKNGPNTYYLSTLAVLPEHQRHGIGSALMDRVIECCRSKKTDNLKIEADSSGVKKSISKKFYEGYFNRNKIPVIPGKEVGSHTILIAQLSPVEVLTTIENDAMCAATPVELLMEIRDDDGPGGLLEQALGGGIAINAEAAGVLESVGVLEKVGIASSFDKSSGRSPELSRGTSSAKAEQMPSRNDGKNAIFSFTGMMRGQAAAETQDRINVVINVMSKEKDVNREIIRAHIIDFVYGQIKDTNAPEKVYTINAWEGYAAPSQASLLTKIRKLTKDKQYRVNFDGIGELVSFACNNVNDSMVTIIPLNMLDVDQVIALRNSNARVIYINLENPNIGADDLIDLEGLIGTGKAYLNNDEESFYRLYRLLAKEPVSEYVALADLKVNPMLFIERLKFYLKPIIPHNPSERDRIRRCQETLLESA